MLLLHVRSHVLLLVILDGHFEHFDLLRGQLLHLFLVHLLRVCFVHLLLCFFFLAILIGLVVHVVVLRGVHICLLVLVVVHLRPTGQVFVLAGRVSCFVVLFIV